jgi:copper resistance protein B
MPRIDANVYGKDDRSRGIGRGLSDATLGLRAQYQITRQFAPYIGVERYQKFGNTADFLPEGIKARDTRWIAGVRFWF